MTMGCPDFQRVASLSRRRLLTIGAAGFAGANLPALLRASDRGAVRSARAKHVIYLHQFGGPSHVDTFDMKPGAASGIRSVFSPIASAVPGVPVCELLPRFAGVLGEFAQVRSVHHRMRNHNSAGYYSLSGHAPLTDDQRLPDGPDLFPGLGALASRFRPTEESGIPSWVSYPYRILDVSFTPGQGGGFLGKAYDPLFIDADPKKKRFQIPELSLPEAISPDRMADRASLLDHIDRQGSWLETSADGLDAYRERAAALLASVRVKRAFDLSSEPEVLREAYGRTTYGQGCLLARRLIESGVRFVTVYFSRFIGGSDEKGGWDTHGYNTKQLKERLLPITDQAVPTLIADLKSRGLLDETLVVWMGEFGRTPRIQNTPRFGPDGRDHWPQCYTALLAGGGIRGGAIYGASDAIGAYPASDPTSPDDVAATILWALGIDPAEEIHDRAGRPFPAAGGAPIRELFG
jgi:hypothetical protein